MVPKPCPLIPTETYILVPHLLHLLHALHALVREIIPNTIHTYSFSSIVRLRLRAFGAQTPPELVIAYIWHDSDGAGGIAVYLFLRNCLSSELRVGCCQYSRAFLL